jgi:Ni,Fe-hydrogenase III large subunit
MSSPVQNLEFREPAARAAAAAEELEDLVLELDGEIITRAVPDVGYLHRGDEKIAENMTYTQFIPYTDRLDYLAPLANNVAYALAVEKLLGIDKQLPARCQFIRVICCEPASGAWRAICRPVGSSNAASFWMK